MSQNSKKTIRFFLKKKGRKSGAKKSCRIPDLKRTQMPKSIFSRGKKLCRFCFKAFFIFLSFKLQTTHRTFKHVHSRSVSRVQQETRLKKGFEFFSSSHRISTRMSVGSGSYPLKTSLREGGKKGGMTRWPYHTMPCRSAAQKKCSRHHNARASINIWHMKIYPARPHGRQMLLLVARKALIAERQRQRERQADEVIESLCRDQKLSQGPNWPLVIKGNNGVWDTGFSIQQHQSSFPFACFAVFLQAENVKCKLVHEKE